MSNQAQQATAVTTGQVRLSYVHLFQPHANQPGQEAKYSTTILVPKSDVATMQRINAAIEAAAQKGTASIWNGVRPPQLKTPIWDGDGFRDNGEPFGPECKGHWVLTASSKTQQAIVDLGMNPIIDQSQVYSGMFGRVNINFFPYLNSGKKGVGAGLGPVQKLADGEPLGGRISAEQAFGNAPAPVAPGYGQPSYGQPPAQQQPAYPQQPAYGQAPGYGQAPAQPQAYGQQPPAYPQQPPAPQQPAQQQFDPITGKPLNGGGVYGI